jgi:hypothetical protein
MRRQCAHAQASVSHKFYRVQLWFPFSANAFFFLGQTNHFKPAAWHDAMPAALEGASAYAITAITFDEKQGANPNATTLTTHADANVRCIAAT